MSPDSPIAEAVDQIDEDTTVIHDYEEDGPQYDYDCDDGPEVQITAGMGVRHPTYGKGIVEELVNEYGAMKIVVNFHEFGKRKVAGHHLKLIR